MNSTEFAMDVSQVSTTLLFQNSAVTVNEMLSGTKSWSSDLKQLLCLVGWPVLTLVSNTNFIFWYKSTRDSYRSIGVMLCIIKIFRFMLDLNFKVRIKVIMAILKMKTMCWSRINHSQETEYSVENPKISNTTQYQFQGEINAWDVSSCGKTDFS